MKKRKYNINAQFYFNMGIWALLPEIELYSKNRQFKLLLGWLNVCLVLSFYKIKT